MKFIPGLYLSRQFFEDEVKPIIESGFPGLQYSAGLMGEGSEVLGYDTERSTDHDWGPRVQIFLAEADYSSRHQPITEALSRQLPRHYLGYPTGYRTSAENGVKMLDVTGNGPIKHRVEIYTTKLFVADVLGLDYDQPPSLSDWLTTPEEQFLILTAGAVFSDGLNQLEIMRSHYKYYPDQVWLYLLAAQWKKIAQEEAFVGRAGDVGDELGSQLLAAKIVGYIMKLVFLMERRYAPYGKWFGTGFAALNSAPQLLPDLQKALLAKSWSEREAHLGRAYETIARLHNELQITESIAPKLMSHYYDRPYKVIMADRFVDAITASIKDEQIKNLLPIGGVDQFVASTDLVTRPDVCHDLASLYQH